MFLSTCKNCPPQIDSGSDQTNPRLFSRGLVGKARHAASSTISSTTNLIIAKVFRPDQK
ncbi:hypothetical protein DSO57_1014657 [Entomophthora muscae]|uniref:Uncharacterized protein n=1 Tax=Entomophthora muscae TaxID=34485 RepID=A0ACC2S7T3_9FUNG|nr:hypothetical protein DSO57_1014657 [Entomophthora muscae]